MTKIMSEEADSFTLSELASYSSEMHKTANTLLNLLQNLLEWAQMQKGGIGFYPVKLNLDELINQNIHSIEKSINAKNIILTIDVPENIGIMADERMIDSILRNLISNAVKFTSREGMVKIAAKILDNGMVEISIKDSGIGMADSLLSKLFVLGEKVGRAGTEGEQSTGLGLFLCKDFVVKHGGNIWAESEVGIGTTFYFTVPEWNVKN